jgi:hypothetical protein
VTLRCRRKICAVFPQSLAAARRIALLGRFRVERRSSGDGSSVMTMAVQVGARGAAERDGRRGRVVLEGTGLEAGLQECRLEIGDLGVLSGGSAFLADGPCRVASAAFLKFGM